jgi:predicted permease
MKDLNKTIKSKRNILKAIGIVEIIGGISGIGLIIWLMLQGFQTNSKLLLVFLVLIAFYGFSIFAGIELFKKKEKSINYSRILQYFQIFAISFGGITYLLSSGGNLFVGYNLTKSTLEFNFSLLASEFQINITNSDQDSFVYLNFWAIILLNLIENSTKKIETELGIEKEKKENYLKRINESMNSPINE